MKTVRIVSALLFVCWMPLPSFAEMSHIFSVEEYAAELDKLSELVERGKSDPKAANTAIDDLRGGWTVKTETGSFDLSTSWLVSQFEKLGPGEQKNVAEPLSSRISGMKNDALAYQQPNIEEAGARAKLQTILARSEFHQVHGPTWLDRLRYKVGQWLFDFLSRFFSSSSVPVIGRGLVWGLVGLAVAALAWFIYREMKRNARVEGFIPDILPVSAKNWAVWLAEAKAAAAQQNWREAVHLAYWAGISFLEANGAWRPDQARTPREYLKLMSPGSELRPTLSMLTRQFEVTWYGSQPAGSELFAETLNQLEKLGCRQ